MQRTNKKVQTAVLWLETVFAVFVIISVIIGGVELFQYVRIILFAQPPDIYNMFRDMLGYLLLLVIGLELALMLIRHTPGSVIEVMFFAIARKILIYTTETYEFLIGVVALAGLFAIRRFLFVPKISDIGGTTLSAATPVKDANRIIGSHIPEDLANTLGGVIAHLAEAYEESIEVGKNFHIADVNMQVVAVTGGLIEKIKVDKLDTQIS
ncbi:MAG TPA: transporter associated domain-containing protein [Bacillota bacterium]|nr:transporter associated domain-containing protein [Bacillota bacterium]